MTIAIIPKLQIYGSHNKMNKYSWKYNIKKINYNNLNDVLKCQLICDSSSWKCGWFHRHHQKPGALAVRLPHIWCFQCLIYLWMFQLNCRPAKINIILLVITVCTMWSAQHTFPFFFHPPPPLHPTPHGWISIWVFWHSNTVLKVIVIQLQVISAQ